MQTAKKLSFQVAAIWLLAIVLFTGCTKEYVNTPDSGNTPPPPSGNKKLSKIEYDGGSYESIQYNTNGTVSKITNHIDYGSGTPDHTIYSFMYTGTVLSEVRGDDGITFKYTYANQKVVKTEIYAAGGNLVAYYEYSYTNGKLFRTDGHTRLGGSTTIKLSFRYENEYFNNGNLKKMTIYYRDPSTGLLEKSSEYVLIDYDAKRNTTALFENNPYLPMETFIPNNPLSEQHYDMNGMLEATVTHVYTYDADGNPLTRKTTTKYTGLPDEIENTRFYY